MTPTPTDLDERWVAALRQPAPAPDLDAAWAAVQARTDQASARPRRWPALVAAAVLVATGLAVWRIAGDGGDIEGVKAGQPPPTVTGEWEQLPDLPLSPRRGSVVARVDDELLVIGGDTFLCPPNADCIGPEGETRLTDGAALDLASGDWRPIAPAPVPVADAEAVVAGTDVFVSAPSGQEGGGTVLRYDAVADTWEDLGTDGLTDPTWVRLVATDAAVVAYAGSDEGGAGPALARYDTAAGRWLAYPGPPLPALFDRTVVWSEPSLYVLGKELVDNPGSAVPSVVIGARFDVGTGEWERLPDSEVIGSGPWLVDGGRIVSPALGTSDGGEVGNWGRPYFDGGIYDAAAGRWLALPRPDPDVPTPQESRDGTEADGPVFAGAVGPDAATFGFLGGGIVFDVAAGTWSLTLPPLPGYAGPEDDRRAVAVGRDAVVVGGVDWSDPAAGRLLVDVWIWRAPPP